MSPRYKSRSSVRCAQRHSALICVVLKDFNKAQVCESCPMGTFNSHESSEQCIPCSACEKGIAKQCTPEHDTICVGALLCRITSSTKENTAGSPLVQNMTDTTTGRGIDGGISGSTLVPIYCIALGSLFIGLLVYAILKRQHTKKTSRWCCSGAQQQKHVR